MSWTVWLTLAVGVALIIAYKRYASRLSPEETEKSRRAVEDGAVLVYCHSGARSSMAVSYLRQQGFARALDLRVMRNWAAISR